jgi:hypothetical protein
MRKLQIRMPQRLPAAEHRFLALYFYRLTRKEII